MWNLVEWGMSIRFGAAMGLLEGAGAFKYAGKLAKTG
jgi:hypothetical protein